MRTILVVDDFAPFRTRARALLEAAGWDVVGEAADGRSAVDGASSLRPDVVLLDVGLPDLDGFEVTAALRHTGSASTVVLMSSRDARSYGPRIAASGAAGFLPKDELSGTALAAIVDGAIIDP